MHIDVLCTSTDHPIQPRLRDWCERQNAAHNVALLEDKSELRGGDILFLISCAQIIPKKDRDRYQHTLVIHASDLPKGRGWSPLVWTLLAGETEVTVCLLNAEDAVDTGDIWARRKLSIPKTALHDEINQILFDAEIALMDEALALILGQHRPVPQPDGPTSYFPKRTPQDSQINPEEQTVAEIFDLLRLADPVRYPVYFDLHGERFTLTLDKTTKMPTDKRSQ